MESMRPKEPTTFAEIVEAALDNLSASFNFMSNLSDKSVDAIYEATRLIKQAQLKEDAKRMRIDDRASYKKDMTEAKKQPRGPARDAAIKMAKDKRNLDKDLFKIINEELVVNEQIRKNLLEEAKLDNRASRFSKRFEKMSMDDPNYNIAKGNKETAQKTANRAGNTSIKFKEEQYRVTKKTTNELIEKYPFAKDALTARATNRDNSIHFNLSGNRDEMKAYRQRVNNEIEYAHAENSAELQPNKDFFAKPLGKRDLFMLGVRDRKEALKAKVEKIMNKIAPNREEWEKENKAKDEYAAQFTESKANSKKIDEILQAKQEGKKVVEGADGPKLMKEKGLNDLAPKAKEVGDIRKKLDISSEIKSKSTTKSSDVSKSVDAPTRDLGK